jgi:hypothetical protein
VGLAVRHVLPTTGGTRVMSPAMKTLVTAMPPRAPTVAFSPTSSAQPTDPAASPAFGPCDWVTTADAADILGAPVTPQPSDDAAGSNDPRCYYAASGERIGVGISSELIAPAASAVADTMLAHAATEPGAATIDRRGINAVCIRAERDASAHHHHSSTGRRSNLPIDRGLQVLRHRRAFRPNGHRPNRHLATIAPPLRKEPS